MRVFAEGEGAGRDSSQPTCGLPLECGIDEDAGREQSTHVHTDSDAQAGEHIQYVFRGDIAGGPRGIGAAAESGDGRIHHGHAHFQARMDVGERLADIEAEKSSEPASRSRRSTAGRTSSGACSNEAEIAVSRRDRGKTPDSGAHRGPPFLRWIAETGKFHPVMEVERHDP